VCVRVRACVRACACVCVYLGLCVEAALCAAHAQGTRTQPCHQRQQQQKQPAARPRPRQHPLQRPCPPLGSDTPLLQVRGCIDPHKSAMDGSAPHLGSMDPNRMDPDLLRSALAPHLDLIHRCCRSGGAAIHGSDPHLGFPTLNSTEPSRRSASSASRSACLQVGVAMAGKATRCAWRAGMQQCMHITFRE